MIADSYIVTEGSVCPGSFGGLMALYEGNFIKLDSLIGDPAKFSGPAVSRTPDDFPVHLSIEEQTKYTRVLRMTYLFDDSGRQLADPDLHVRLYLDARLAEVRSWAGHHRHGMLLQLRQQYGRELDRRWSRNMMLCKWLDYLVDRNHRLHPCDATCSGLGAAMAE